MTRLRRWLDQWAASVAAAVTLILLAALGLTVEAVADVFREIVAAAVSLFNAKLPVWVSLLALATILGSVILIQRRRRPFAIEPDHSTKQWRYGKGKDGGVDGTRVEARFLLTNLGDRELQISRAEVRLGVWRRRRATSGRVAVEVTSLDVLVGEASSYWLPLESVQPGETRRTAVDWFITPVHEREHSQVSTLRGRVTYTDNLGRAVRSGRVSWHRRAPKLSRLGG